MPKELSKQARGGISRAERLSPDERREIASRGAEARWGGAENALLPKETHTGFIKIGEELIQCSVLDNGMRVFSTRAIARTMGSKAKGGRKGESDNGAPMLPTFLSSDSLRDFISRDLMVPLVSPIQYRPKHGGRTAFGYEASLLPKICGVIIDADRAGVLQRLEKMASTANILIRAFAQVGVVALIDEATGYQEERAKDELARILEAYVQAEYRPWTRMFPEEFFRQTYRVHGWDYKPGTAKRTPLVGHIINKYIYGQLPPGVLDELRRVNPITEGGYRRRKHFQHLTADTGNEHLDRQITSVITLMRVSDSREELEHNFAKAFGKPSPGIQQRLPLLLEASQENKA